MRIPLLRDYPGFVYLAVSLIWLLSLSRLMIADVWDETNALLIFAAEPVSGASALEAALMIWRQELPLDMYRPFPNSLIMILGKLFQGNFVMLRLTNAAFVLAAAGLLTSSLARLGVSEERRFAFFLILLFSASALITSTWFANIYDASCLLFFALAVWAYCRRMVLLCCVAIALAIFSKENYVLAVPFFALLILNDKSRDFRTALILLSVLIGVSLCYWLLRQNAVTLGSEQDIHSFDIDNLIAPTVGFLAGFIFQFSKFSLYSPVFWLGLAGLFLALASIRDRRALAAIVATLAMSGIVYWGMFGFQNDNLISFLNFVGRLYLLPFVVLLLILFLHAGRKILLVVALLSLWGFGQTYRDHGAFQSSYLQLYELAAQSEETLLIHYPEKPLVDPARNLQIGDFPDTGLRLNTRDGGLRRQNAD